MIPTLLLVALAAAQPQDFEHDEEGELLEFHYAWPAQAEAVPGLRALLRQDMHEERRRAIQWAREAGQAPRLGRSEFDPHWYEKDWEFEGESPRLLSLSASDSHFTGGAHANLGVSALLWDRVSNRELQARSLFGRSLLRRMTARFCSHLEEERAGKRTGESAQRDRDDPFGACPPLANQVLVPVDADENGRFETLRVLIPPYVAGPYAEGTYEIDLPFMDRDIGSISRRYRSSFEAGESDDSDEEEEP